MYGDIKIATCPAGVLAGVLARDLAGVLARDPAGVTTRDGASFVTPLAYTLLDEVGFVRLAD